jgi:hypothetical protein
MNLLEAVSQVYQIQQVSTNLFTTSEHDSLRIWTHTNTWYWFSRGIGGGLKEWLQLNNYSRDEIDDIVGKQDPNIIPLEDNNFLDYDMFINTFGQFEYNNYIKSRNISEETARKFGIEARNDDIIIPILDYKGKRVGNLVRHKNRTPKYHKFLIEPQPVFYNPNIDASKTTYIFEGTWSVMRFLQVTDYSINALATLQFKIGRQHFEYLNGLNNVVWCLDYDTDKNGILLQRVIDKRNLIKQMNKFHKVIINKTMPDEMSDDGIKRLVCSTS